MKKITKTALILATGLSTLLVASNSYAHHTIFSSPLMSCKGANQFYCNVPSDNYPLGMDTLKSGSINVDSDGSLQIKINGAPANKTYQLFSINYIPTNNYSSYADGTGYFAPIWCDQTGSTTPGVECGPRYQYQYLNNGDGMLGSFTTDSKGKYNGPVKFLASPTATLPTIFKFNPGTVIPSMSFAVTDDGNHHSEFITGITTKLATDNDDD